MKKGNPLRKARRFSRISGLLHQLFVVGTLGSLILFVPLRSQARASAAIAPASVPEMARTEMLHYPPMKEFEGQSGAARREKPDLSGVAQGAKTDKGGN